MSTTANVGSSLKPYKASFNATWPIRSEPRGFLANPVLGSANHICSQFLFTQKGLEQKNSVGVFPQRSKALRRKGNFPNLTFLSRRQTHFKEACIPQATGRACSQILNVKCIVSRRRRCGRGCRRC